MPVGFGKFLREYRQRKNITQRELAISLGVTNMTISRYESGQQDSLPIKMADRIALLLDEEDVKRLDLADSEEAKILNSYQYLKNAEQTLTRDEFSKQAIFDFKRQMIDCVEKILPKLGFERTDSMPFSRFLDCEELYLNPDTNKVWIINAYDKIPKESGQSFLSEFFCRLGKIQTAKQVNKYSFIFPGALSTIQKELEEVTICNPLCDISVLHYSDDGTIDGELDVALLKDGRGLFDLDEQNPDKCAQAMADYTRWKLSITKAVLESD